jgi:predicted GIY-YIG superfamily endonuclease
MNADSTYYVLASGHHGTLDIGVTRDLRTRLEQHRAGRGSKFVSKYKIHRLVYVESFASTTPERRSSICVDDVLMKPQLADNSLSPQ